MSIVKVAKLAKVSTATVSRVTNGSGPVNPGTIRRVQKAMQKVGYVPKPFTSRPGPRVGSQNNKTGIIALVMCMNPSFLAHSPVLSSAVHGVEEALTQRGLSRVQVYIQPGSPVPPILLKNGIGGSLVIGAIPENKETVLRRHACVTLMSEVPLHSDNVFCDNVAIGELAFEYLKERGHQHVAFMTLHQEHPAMITRHRAFCGMAEKAQVQVDLFEYRNKWGNDLLGNHRD